VDWIEHLHVFVKDFFFTQKPHQNICKDHEIMRRNCHAKMGLSLSLLATRQQGTQLSQSKQTGRSFSRNLDTPCLSPPHSIDAIS
jgi:hypothetical protein